MRVHIFASALLVLCSVMIDASEPLTIAVSPMQSFAPTNLTIRVHVAPDASNRALEVITESGGYYRSSRVQLDGADAPRTIWLEMRNVPGGDYEVRGTLIDSAGRQRTVVHTRVVVLGSAESD